MSILNKFIKKYYLELIAFSLIAIVILIDLTPDITWINTDCDGPHYIYSAKYLYPAHKSSAPLYLLIGHFFLMLPFGTEAWRMALISGISGIIGSIYIYFIVRHFTQNRLYGIISSLMYGGSALALSQNIIVETYPMLTTAVIIAYYYAVKSKWLVSSLFLGIAGAIHPLMIMIGLPMVIKFKELRNWKYLVIMASFLLFYLYIPITNRPPYMWNQSNASAGIFGWVQDTWSTAQMLGGGLSIWDFPKRILDTAGLLIVNWTIGIVSIVVYFWKLRDNGKWYKDILFWFIVLPIGYYAVNLAPQTYVYMQPAIAFGAVAAGIGFSELHKNWTYSTIRAYATIIIVSGMLLYNGWYFDVGKNLDPNLSAREFYDKELIKVPDNQILLAQQGWEWAIVFPYNKDEGKNIIPVHMGTLASEFYRNEIKEQGVKFDVPNKSDNLTLVELQRYVTESIIKNNDNVWITVPVAPKTYGAEIIPVKTYKEKLAIIPNKNLTWQWKPSNPYDIITGSIEVEEWIYIIFSNYSVLTFIMMGTIGAVPVWMCWMMFVKKKKWSIGKAINTIREVA